MGVGEEVVACPAAHGFLQTIMVLSTAPCLSLLALVLIVFLGISREEFSACSETTLPMPGIKKR